MAVFSRKWGFCCFHKALHVDAYLRQGPTFTLLLSPACISLMAPWVHTCRNGRQLVFGDTYRNGILHHPDVSKHTLHGSYLCHTYFIWCSSLLLINSFYGFSCFSLISKHSSFIAILRGNSHWMNFIFLLARTIRFKGTFVPGLVSANILSI